MRAVIQFTIIEVYHSDESKWGRNSCLWFFDEFFPSLDDWEANTGCQLNRTSVPQPRSDFGHLAGMA